MALIDIIPLSRLVIQNTEVDITLTRKQEVFLSYQLTSHDHSCIVKLQKREVKTAKCLPPYEL